MKAPAFDRCLRSSATKRRRTKGPGPAALPCAAFAAIFLPIAASAANDRAFAPTSAQSQVDQPTSAPQWTISVEGIVLERLGGVDRTLVARVPGTVPFLATSIAPGVAAFNSNQFQQGFSAGPKIGLTYHDDSGFGVEVSYFNIFNQSATA